VGHGSHTIDRSQVSLVDLAGSERLKQSQSEGTAGHSARQRIRDVP
jgi:hypothetical protein